MPAQHSAGIVLYRRGGGAAVESATEVLLVHPGGPYWAKKDQHGWSIPKGEFDPDLEPSEDAARREFEEELGQPVPACSDGGTTIALPVFKAGRKTIHAYLLAADFDPETVASNTIDIEWPPRSGQTLTIPEVDRAAWFSLAQARDKLHKGQAALVDLILQQLTSS